MTRMLRSADFREFFKFAQPRAPEGIHVIRLPFNEQQNLFDYLKASGKYMSCSGFYR
jgi:hypothetical protein